MPAFLGKFRFEGRENCFEGRRVRCIVVRL